MTADDDYSLQPMPEPEKASPASPVPAAEPTTTPTVAASSANPNSGLLLSFVIPVFNEEESLEALHAEIHSVADDLAAVEIVFVDDGSSDGSWQTIRRLQEKDATVSAIRFRRNFGKAAALTAGFAAAHGDRVFTLDADLQDDPREIPKFLRKIDDGYDVVSGWKKIRHDPWHKTMPSLVFNAMVSRLTGVFLHDHNCGFKCYRDEVLDEIQLYGEFHRFTGVLADARGFRVGEVIVRHRARKFGQSKYGWRRFLRGFVDLLTIKFLTSFQNRPQHLLGSLGILFFCLGLLGLGCLSFEWFLTQLGWASYGPLHQRPLLTFSATTLLLGAQMLSIGLLAELITARNQHETNIYSVAERRLGTRWSAPEPTSVSDNRSLRKDLPTT